MRSKHPRRAAELPEEISPLLDGADPATLDRSWSEFTKRFTPLILHTAGKVFRDRDGRMDAYAHVLEHLRADDFRRLKTFSRDGRSSFATWLVVVSQRLCLDFHRQRYGRARPSDDPRSTETRRTRRRLVDLMAEELDPSHVVTVERDSPEWAARQAELMDRLGAALSGIEPRDRLLLARRFVDDESVRSIARSMRYESVFQVYRHLKQVLATLRTELEKSGIDGADG